MAAAGYGKTTALEADQPPDGVLCTAAEALAHDLREAPWIGVDAFDGVDVNGQRELVRRLAALPRDTGVCLAARNPLDTAVRGDLAGQFFERGPADLALAPYPSPGCSPRSTPSSTPRRPPASTSSPRVGQRSCTSPGTSSRGSRTPTSLTP